MPSTVASSFATSSEAAAATPRPSSPTRASKMSASLLAIVLASLTLGGCLGYDGEIQHGYQLDQTAVADVKQGQTAEQVLVTMGSPSTTSTVGGDAWYYISQKTDRSVAFLQPKIVDQHIYAVYFDKGKKVSRIANYGMRDGKVINFAANETPTVGADSSLLKGLFLNFNPFGNMIPKT